MGPPIEAGSEDRPRMKVTEVDLIVILVLFLMWFLPLVILLRR
jgi:hypothetical protein